ncbi:hypothetical protein HOD61_01610 [archaeon]|jgi:hypothetical protein|nr:hypothetical protein [archaeon]
MNKLKTFLATGCFLGSLYCTSPILAEENTAQKDTINIDKTNVEFKIDNLSDYPFYSNFFDSKRSWIEYDYNSLNDFNGEVRVNELEKKLSKDFDFFIKSKPYEVNVGIRFNF